MLLKVLMFLLTAVAVGGTYAWSGNDPGLVPWVSILAGFGGLAAVEIATYAGWL